MYKNSILIVEDDRGVRSLIAEALSVSGSFLVLTASTGESAIMQVASRDPDIMILDLGLPDIDGMDIIRRVRTWTNHPILVVSARTGDQDRIGALDLDAVAADYLTKPFHPVYIQTQIVLCYRMDRIT